jgi:hypothetical protein
MNIFHPVRLAFYLNNLFAIVKVLFLFLTILVFNKLIQIYYSLKINLRVEDVAQW